MESWKKLKLGDLFERVTRKNTNLESDNVLTISAQYGLINQEKFFNKYVAGKNLKNYYLLKKGEFAYNKSYSAGYPMGATKMLEKYDEGVVSTLYICFRSKSDLVNNEYFKYYFESKQYYDELSKIAQEGARNHGLLNISVDDFFDVQVILPPIKEQEKIVNLLKKIDYLIKKYEKLLKEKDKFVKSQFVEMFENEKSLTYPLLTIGDVYNFQYGKGNKIPESKGEYPCYGSNGQVGYHTEYNNEDAPIIGHIGAYAGVVVWASGKHFVTYNGVMCKLKDKNEINSQYGFYLLKRQNYVNNARKGGAQPFVSYDMLMAPTFRKPPIELQNQFAEIVKQIDKQKNLLEQQKQNYENLKKGLMQQLLTGKVRVKI